MTSLRAGTHTHVGNATISRRRGIVLFAAMAAALLGTAVQAKPLKLEKPYRVWFCLRRSFTDDDWVRETVGRLKGVTASEGKGCFGYTSDSAEAVGNLLNEIEWTVLKP